MRNHNQSLYIVRQSDYQIYYDDSGVNTATPRAPVNAPAFVQAGERARVRIEILNDSLDSSVVNYKYILEYKLNDNDWEPVLDTTAPRYIDSPHFVDGAATTIKRLGTEPYTPGEAVETPRATAAIALDDGYTTELEFSLLLPSSLQQGDTILFRVVAVADTPTDRENYTATLLYADWENYTATLLYYDNYPTIIVSTGGHTTMAETPASLSQYGIAIAPDPTKAYKAVKLIDAVACDISPRVERIITSTMRGALAPRRALTARVWAEGSITTLATPNHLVYILLAAGYPQSTSGTTAPYTHLIKWGAGLPSKYATIVAWHTNSTPPYHEIYAGLAARRISISADAEAGEPLQLSADLVGTIYGVHNTNTLTDLFTSATPAADGDDPFVQTLATIESPAGTTLTRFTRCSIDFAFERDPRFTLRNSIFARGQQPVRSVRVTGSLTAVFGDDADLRRFLNQTAPSYPYKHANDPGAFTTSLKLTFSNARTGASERRFTIELPIIALTEISNPKRVGEIVMVEVGFESLYDAANSAAAILTVRNAAPATEYADATAEISPNLNI